MTCCAKGVQQQAAFKTLRHTMRTAQHTWAHELLHEAANSTDIWHMATTCKGHQVNTFPALHTTDNTLVEDPNLKAKALKAQFFPPVHTSVNIDQPDDPTPLPTH